MDGDYDSDRDRRVCPDCGEVFVGGSTATFWELHDHRAAEHPDSAATPSDGGEG